MPPSTQTPDSRLQKRQKELDDATLKLLTTSNNVGLAIREWKDSLDALSTVGPSMHKVHGELDSMREELDKSQKEFLARIEIYKKKKEEVAMKTISSQWPNKMKGWVEEEAGRQTESLLDSKLQTACPVSGEQIMRDMAKYTHRINTNLSNSHARSSNSTLTLENGLLRLISAVSMPDLDRTSKVYPSNLQSFFFYSDEEIRQLCTDYKIPVSQSKTVNMSRFLAYIGVKNVHIPVYTLDMTSAEK